MYTPPQRHLIGKFAVSPISLAIALTFSLLGTNLSYAQTVPENFLEPGKQTQINESQILNKPTDISTIEDIFSSINFKPVNATDLTIPISDSQTYSQDTAFIVKTSKGVGIGVDQDYSDDQLTELKAIDISVDGSFTMVGSNGSYNGYKNALISASKDRMSKISLSADNLYLQSKAYVVANGESDNEISLRAKKDIYIESLETGLNSTIYASGLISILSENGNIGINSQLSGSALYVPVNGGEIKINAGDSLWVKVRNTGSRYAGIQIEASGKANLTAKSNIILTTLDTNKALIRATAGASVSVTSGNLVDIVGDVYAGSNSNINISSSKVFLESNQYSALDSERGSSIVVNGTEATLINGEVYSFLGAISINENTNSSTFITGPLYLENAKININSNGNQASQVILIGDATVRNYWDDEQDSQLNVNFGSNGLFKGRAILQAGESNLTFGKNSVWYVEGDSRVTSLNMNTALIDFTAETDKDTSITTDSLNAQNALFLMDVIATSNKVSNDSLKVQKSASGNAFVHVPSSGQGDGKTDSGVLIETPTGQKISYALASPTLSSDGTNTPVIDLGVYNYELKTEDRNGKTVTYLTPYVPKSDPTPDPDPTPTPNPEPNPGEPELSPSANAVLALAGSGMQTTQFLYSLSDLRKRMGEIRYGAEDGLYAGIRGGRDEISSFASTSFRNEYGAWSIGYDHRVNDEWIVGALFEAIEGDQRVKSHGYRADGEDSTQGFRAYATWFNNEGAYADFVVGLNRFDQDISTNMLDGRKVEGDFDGIGWGVSAEVGRQFLMGDDKTWFIEPQAQFAYFRVKGEDFSLDNGMTVDQDSTDSLTGRFGLVFGKTKVDNDGKGYQLTGKFGINHEFMGESDIKVNGVKFSYDSLGTRGYYGVGFNWYLSKHARVYGQVEREQGSRFTSEINARLGVKYHF